MTLGERIALARKQAGLSQEQLGEKLGVSRQAVSKWESSQTNPDVAYVAQICRLLELSSDWLLLGEEGAWSAAPERCPGCQGIVSGLDQYCPSCGRSLRGGYAILLQAPKPHSYPPIDDLIRLSKSGIFPQGSPLSSPLTRAEAEALLSSAPQVLARGLTKEQLASAWNATIYPNCFLFFQDNGKEDDPEILVGYPRVNPEDLVLTKPREPVSFGMVVLAVIVGIVGGIFLLSIL